MRRRPDRSMVDSLLRGVYALGWRVAARIPDRVAEVIIAAGARLATAAGSAALATWRHNVTVLTSRPCPDDLVRRGVASYLRNFHQVLALARWSRAEIDRRVVLINDAALRAALDADGAVVVLPHSGNWDLAGAWACLNLRPVSTVAEELGEGEFAAFVKFREGLGMEVIAHTDPNALSTLIAAVKAGRLVCLIGDRDLAGSGVEVTWRLPYGKTATTRMPAGPAVVARRTGAALIPAVTRFAGRGLEVVLGDPVEHRPGRDGLVAMTQQVCDFFAAELPQQPEDWHLFQPFFPAEAAA
ncbi:phosphatidylinositol mannoside acyltransferase [Microlunatus parietis]|uniref:KDO2-lipid IV(A) lauroyltransferase n=1 Tax=Microlunatus parietis TaxID=682979 RepID=A0A7Y9L8S1_9ACTN|nr:phosphatidylinositol mannoside acyltransferase [Microlunatus parietis]NYE68762.1 KDO2-lipid IV(A) lauroyltransferase [Microlunatus parietis]